MSSCPRYRRSWRRRCCGFPASRPSPARIAAAVVSARSRELGARQRESRTGVTAHMTAEAARATGGAGALDIDARTPRPRSTIGSSGGRRPPPRLLRRSGVGHRAAHTSDAARASFYGRRSAETSRGVDWPAARIANISVPSRIPFRRVRRRGGSGCICGREPRAAPRALRAGCLVEIRAGQGIVATGGGAARCAPACRAQGRGERLTSGAAPPARSGVRVKESDAWTGMKGRS